MDQIRSKDNWAVTEKYMIYVMTTLILKVILRLKWEEILIFVLPKMMLMEVIYLLNIKQWNVYRVLWRRLNPLTQRRLDFFLISSCLQPAITKCEIIPSVGTDHSSIILQVRSDIKENHGPSYWKFNSSLINDSTYVQEMKAYIKTAKEEVINIRLDPRENGNISNTIFVSLLYLIQKKKIENSKSSTQFSKKKLKK